MFTLHSLDEHPDIHHDLLSSQKADARIMIRPLNHGISCFRNKTRLFNTENALLLFEKNYSPVLYVPKADIFQRHFLPAINTSYCPYKGRANYWSLNVDDKIVLDAVWEYRKPEADVGVIENHIAFANYQYDGQYLIYER